MDRIAFVGTFPASLAEAVRAGLGAPCDIILVEESGVLERMPELDVLVSMAFDATLGAAARRLRLVQVPGAGLDRVDRTALPRGAALANVYGHEAGIAEYVLGAMLTLSRGFLSVDPALRRGEWQSQWAVDAKPPPPAVELAGRTLGILGYGHIGQAVARRARAFDMQVLAIRREVGQSQGDALALLGGLDRLDEVLRRSDYLVVTLPLTPATRGLLGAPQFALMKPDAVLINVARGEIAEEDALYAALAERRIAGAALDVWYRYPTGPGATLPATRPFHTLTNVLLTPHHSGWTDGTLANRARLIAENIRRTARGEPPLNLIAAA